MKPKQLLIIIIAIATGWWAFDVIRTHTSGDVIAYKSFAKALMRGDAVDARREVARGADQPMSAFNFQEERREIYFQDSERVFTYYRILSHHRPSDNRSVIRAEQVTRVNLPGESKFYGVRRIGVIHSVELIREQSAWRVLRFTDEVMR